MISWLIDRLLVWSFIHSFDWLIDWLSIDNIIDQLIAWLNPLFTAFFDQHLSPLEFPVPKYSKVCLIQRWPGHTKTITHTHSDSGHFFLFKMQKKSFLAWKKILGIGISAEINGQDWRNRSKVPRARDGDRAWSSWDHADKQSNIHHTAYTAHTRFSCSRDYDLVTIHRDLSALSIAKLCIHLHWRNFVCLQHVLQWKKQESISPFLFFYRKLHIDFPTKIRTDSKKSILHAKWSFLLWIPYVIPKNTHTQNAFRYFSWHVSWLKICETWRAKFYSWLTACLE